MIWLAVLAIFGGDYKSDWAKMAPIVPRQMACYRAAVPPTIDGRLDDAAWRAVPFTDDFQDIEGAAKPRPRFRTRMKLLWDANYLYVGADLEEPNVWATLTKRDSIIYVDNDFEIFIDPDGDSHEYMEFEINALGTGWDLRLPKPYKDHGRALIDWNIDGLKSAVHVRGTLNRPGDRDDGWSVELALPWTSLRPYANCPAPPRVGDAWRFNASRVEWQVNVIGDKIEKVPKRPEDNWVWSPQGVIDMHRPERWGWIHFVDEARPPAGFTPDDTLPIRNALQEVNYEQADYCKKHGMYANRLELLGQRSGIGPGSDIPVRMEMTATGYRLLAEQRRSDGTRRTWQIDDESRIRLVP